jgi:hypothetical protein
MADQKNNRADEDDDDLDAGDVGDVPPGAAVLPIVPPDLGVHPLLLAALHAYVFLDGSDEPSVHPAAAEEALEYMIGYFQRLQGPELRRIQEDMEVLIGFAKEDRWPREAVLFLKNFLKDCGVTGESPADANANADDDEDPEDA